MKFITRRIGLRVVGVIQFFTTETRSHGENLEPAKTGTDRCGWGRLSSLTTETRRRS